MDRITLTDDSVNSYGFRVLTQGGDLSAFEKNPVMLNAHRDWDLDHVIGAWTEIRIENDQLSAVPDFDMGDDAAAKIAGKYERGYLKAASIGFQITGISEAPEDMLPGQVLPTVTKWKLMEASIVPIGSNSNAVRLYDQSGKRIDLASPEAIRLAFTPTPPKMEKQNSPSPAPNAVEEVVMGILRKLGLVKTEAPTKEEAPAEPEQSAPTAVQLQAKVLGLQAEVTQLKAQLALAQQGSDAYQAELRRLAAAPAEAPATATPPADPAGAAPQEDRFLTEADRRARLKFGKKK